MATAGSFPTLAWGCGICRYIETPLLGSLLDGDSDQAEQVTEEWKAGFIEDTEPAFCPGPSGCNCIEQALERAKAGG